MQFVSPEGRARPLNIGASARPRSLEGLRIGLLDNSKAPVDKMMVHVEAKLKVTYSRIETYTVSKVAASRPANVQILKALRGLSCHTPMSGPICSGR